MDKPSKAVAVHLGRQGRLEIPATLRQSLGFEEGDTLVAHEEAGRRVWAIAARKGLQHGNLAGRAFHQAIAHPKLAASGDRR